MAGSQLFNVKIIFFVLTSRFVSWCGSQFVQMCMLCVNPSSDVVEFLLFFAFAATFGHTEGTQK